jgi:hypothetical protein
VDRVHPDGGRQGQQERREDHQGADDRAADVAQEEEDDHDRQRAAGERSSFRIPSNDVRIMSPAAMPPRNSLSFALASST